MAETIAMVAAWFPERHFLMVVDSLYSGFSDSSPALLLVKKGTELCRHAHDITPQKLGRPIVVGVAGYRRSRQ